MGNGEWEMKESWHKLLVGLLALGFADVALYGVVRWKKVLVMREACIKERHLLVRYIDRGWWDCCGGWRAAAKNRLAEPSLRLFQPLICVENSARGGEKPVPASR